MPYGTALAGLYGQGGSNLVTTLYTGTNAARSLVTGQNNAAGSLVIGRDRDGTSGRGWYWFDTERGVHNFIQSNSTNAQQTDSSTLTAFNSNGFSLGTDSGINQLGKPEVAYSFLQKAGFMDIVSYTGTGATVQNIPHNLGAVPAMMIIKSYSTSSTAWMVYHKDIGNTDFLVLNGTGASTTDIGKWQNTTPTDSQFTVGNDGNVGNSAS